LNRLLRINKLAMERGCRGERFFALALKKAAALAGRRRRAKDFSPLPKARESSAASKSKGLV
jgi:hypothetical protein